MTITIGIVDDHPTFRVGLRATLGGQPDVDVAWDCGNAADALRMMTRDPVDVIVVDLALANGEDGALVAETLRRKWPELGVLLITGVDTERARLEAERIGGAGSIGKDAPLAVIVDRVKEAASGRAGSVQRQRSRRIQGVTPREYEILRMIGRGMTTREIAIELGISPATVNNHVQSAVRKLKARNRAHAVALVTPSMLQTAATSES